MVEHKSPVEQKIDQSALWVPVFINISMQKHRCIVAKYINATNTLLFVVDDCWNTRAVLMQSRVEKVTSFISGICWNQEMPWMQISSVKTTHSQVCVWLILMTFCVMNVCRSSCSFAVPTRVLFFFDHSFLCEFHFVYGLLYLKAKYCTFADAKMTFMIHFGFNLM